MRQKIWAMAVVVVLFPIACSRDEKPAVRQEQKKAAEKTDGKGAEQARTLPFGQMPPMQEGEKVRQRPKQEQSSEPDNDGLLYEGLPLSSWADQLMDLDQDTQLRASNSLILAGTPAIAVLIKRLKSLKGDGIEERSRMSGVLVLMGRGYKGFLGKYYAEAEPNSEVPNAIARYMRTADVIGRGHALSMLGSIGAPAAPWLQEIARMAKDDKEEMVRRIAKEAYKKISEAYDKAAK